MSPSASTEHIPALAPNANIAFCEALLTELARGGVDHLCICPGSRSAPLAIASLRVPELYPWVHLDERAAAFFALGLAKSSGNAVALFCTSGTAAANFYPAVIEAWYGHVPLIVLTADRPAELREWGGGQTIQQTRLFGDHIRWFAEAPLPEASDLILKTARSIGARAASLAQGEIRGPVHLNLPFREPLTPQPCDKERELLHGLSFQAGRGRRGNRSYTTVHPRCREVPQRVIQELCHLVKGYDQGILLCGEHDSADDYCEQVARFTNIAGWPVIADPVSQLRFGRHTGKMTILACGDLLLRSDGFRKRMAPECIFRVGATLTGKSARVWANEHSHCRHLLVDGQQRWNDPDHLVNDLLPYDPANFFCQLSEALEKENFVRKKRLWLDAWTGAEQIAGRILKEEFAQNNDLLEPAVGEMLVHFLPDGSDLFLASSMPVRDIDSFAPPSTKSIRVFSNRGTNGIDGVISSALGVAADNGSRKKGRQTVLLTGDLTFLHDVGGLLAASRKKLDLTIIVINNDGGGIFSLLPVAEYAGEANFDQFFTTPHGLSFQAAAELYGLDYLKADSLSQFSSFLQSSLRNRGTGVIELSVDLAAGVAMQRRLIDLVVRNIDQSCTEEFFRHD
ncbi:MAG: 2-succinyl-5-enolpyruvyl-6-hydroxy-3-cyclohexene-1-carboxylic-acid synthase [Deltaproteobacteria bacterium]|nr:2-succinyl-5-enolpyruvyl-6-hydroxy-3-cyclohexene-1-carboxylic-acid synthase [Deltaproteobacteria bacterium]